MIRLLLIVLTLLSSLFTPNKELILSTPKMVSSVNNDYETYVETLSLSNKSNVRINYAYLDYDEENFQGIESATMEVIGTPITTLEYTLSYDDNVFFTSTASTYGTTDLTSYFTSLTPGGRIKLTRTSTIDINESSSFFLTITFIKLSTSTLESEVVTTSDSIKYNFKKATGYQIHNPLSNYINYDDEYYTGINNASLTFDFDGGITDFFNIYIKYNDKTIYNNYSFIPTKGTIDLTSYFTSLIPGGEIEFTIQSTRFIAGTDCSIYFKIDFEKADGVEGDAPEINYDQIITVNAGESKSFDFLSDYKYIQRAKVITKVSNEIGAGNLYIRIKYNGYEFYKTVFSGNNSFNLTNEFLDAQLPAGGKFTIELSDTLLVDETASITLYLDYGVEPGTYVEKTTYVDTELENIGVDLYKYQQDTTPKMVLALEKYQSVSNRYILIFYVYNPEGKLYKEANISYKYGRTENSFLNESFTSERCEIKYVGSTGNKKFHKYYSDDITLLSTTYRAFQVNKCYYNDGTYDVFDAEFRYKTNDDGTISSSITTTNYIQLSNEKTKDVFIEENYNGWLGELFKNKKGKNNIFYGFNVDNYDIQDLKEIEFYYDLYDYEALTYGKTDQLIDLKNFSLSNGVFNEDYINKKIASGELTLSEDDLEFISKYYPTYSNAKKNNKKIVTPEDISLDNDHWNYTTTYKWNTIMKRSELSSYCSEELETLLSDNFNNNQFIATIDSFDASCSRTSTSSDKCTLASPVAGINLFQTDEIHDYFESNNDLDPRSTFIKDLYNDNDSSRHCHSIYYQTQSMKQIEIVRMKFVDYNNDEYNLATVSLPIDSSDIPITPEEEPKDDLPEGIITLKEYWNTIKDYVDNTFNTIKWLGYTLIGFIIITCIIFIILIIRWIFNSVIDVSTPSKKKRYKKRKY